MQNTKPASHEQILSIVVGFWQARALAVATGYEANGASDRGRKYHS